MRTKIVAGNWKMHKNAEETEDLLNELINQLPDDKEVEIVVVIVGAENATPPASLRCDKLLKASGEMATISTPCGVSRVESTMASPPTCWRTSLSASVVLAAMNFWGPIYHSALSGAGLRA